MIDMKKAKAYDELMVRLCESRDRLMSAQGKAYVIGILDFNERLIDLQRQIEETRKDFMRAYLELEKES